jgi:hypothetical protein
MRFENQKRNEGNTVKPAFHPLRAPTHAALIALAMPIFAHAAAPFDYSMQYPSAMTSPVPAALRNAIETTLARDPDAAWLEQEVLASDGASGDLFGFRVLVSGNSAFVAAPAPLNHPGKVYVFANVSGTWTEMQQIAATPSVAPPPNWSDFFGWSLSLSGDTLLVGAPEVFNQMFGPVGGAYVFVNAGGTWTQQQELLGADAGSFDWVGSSIALTGDTAFVGAPNHSGNMGEVHIYTRSGTTWTEGTPLVASDGTAGDAHQFGGAVKTDGTTLLVGAPGPDFSSSGAYAPGEAYVFTNTGGTWTQAQILEPDDSADGDQFGFSLALDGSTAIVGTPAANIGANLHQGAVYAFDGSTGTWTQSTKIVADDGAEYDQFGQSVAMQGGNALVGQWSHNDDLGGTQPPPKPGTVYLYSAGRGQWNLSNEFHAGDASNGDSYGWDVGIDGTTLLIGSQATIGANTFQGSAYFYTPADPPIAVVGPASLSFSLAPGASGDSTLSIGNTGGSDLTFAIAETPATAPRIALNVDNATPPMAASQRRIGSLGTSGLSGPRTAAPWTPRDADGALTFSLDDGTYEDTIGLNDQASTEYAAIWLNRFTPPGGTGAFTINTISIEWPDNPNGSLVGKSVNLVAYYDADGDGDPSNAVRLGGDTSVTIASLDAFLDYTVNFAVPGDGDVYVGFENTYALGGTTPIFYPAAIDEGASQNRSWVAGMSSGDPDPDNLANDDLIGTIDSFGLPGNWLIRATGIAGGGGGDCSNPSDVPWLSESPASGTVAAGASQDVTVTADASGLSEGSYSAVLCVTTNDPDHALVAVPVSLTVTVADRIFADGFDGAP